MKITTLTIHNIGILEHVEMPVNKALCLFYGDIKQGKTTILNAIRWVFGGEYPTDIVRHGQTEAYVQIEAEDDGVPLLIRREWYINKEGKCSNRPLVFQRAGVEQPRPAETLKRFLNPFVMDDRYFVDMTDLEKGRYLCRLFNVDTKVEDKEIGEMSEEASQLRIKIKAYGEVIPVAVEPVDTTALLERRRTVVEKHAKARAVAQSEKDEIMARYEADREAKRLRHVGQCAVIDEDNAAVAMANDSITKVQAAKGVRTERLAVVRSDIADLESKLVALRTEEASVVARIAEQESWLDDHPIQQQHVYPNSPAMPPSPDVSAIQARIDALPETEDIDTRIQKAGAINEQHKTYLKDKARQDEKTADELHLIELERAQARLKEQKVAKLARIGAESGIPTLCFVDGGDFTFDGTASSMLSDSQQMQLTEYLKSKYPEGFNISLIDRGESLGKSVMTLVDRARAKKSTIFCSVVGERPAQVPEDVGAFVVEKGKVTI